MPADEVFFASQSAAYERNETLPALGSTYMFSRLSFSTLVAKSTASLFRSNDFSRCRAVRPPGSLYRTVHRLPDAPGPLSMI